MDYLNPNLREHLEDMESSLRSTARRLTAEAAEVREQADALARLIRSMPVTCAWCKQPMPAGRSDKVCCSPSCRAKAYRAQRPVRAQAAVGSLLGTEEVPNG